MGVGKGAPAPPSFSEAATAGIGQGIDRAAGQIGSQGALPTGMEARDQAIQSAYGQATSRLDPQWDRRTESMQAGLANQGIDPGSEAYRRAEQANTFGRNDAYSSAMANAIGQGTQAGNAIFAQGVTSQMLPYQQLGQLQGIQGNDYQNRLAGYGIEQAGKNSLLSGAMGIGAKAAGMP